MPIVSLCYGNRNKIRYSIHLCTGPTFNSGLAFSPAWYMVKYNLHPSILKNFDHSYILTDDCLAFFFYGFKQLRSN